MSEKKIKLDKKLKEFLSKFEVQEMLLKLTINEVFDKTDEDKKNFIDNMNILLRSQEKPEKKKIIH